MQAQLQRLEAVARNHKLAVQNEAIRAVQFRQPGGDFGEIAVKRSLVFAL
jgi:hypothetical protein